MDWNKRTYTVKNRVELIDSDWTEYCNGTKIPFLVVAARVVEDGGGGTVVGIGVVSASIEVWSVEP